MPNTEYITTTGDRWDTVSFKAYGDASLYPKIQSANPFIPRIDTLQGGIHLQIPIIIDNTSTDESLLPPWKRGTTESVQKAKNQVDEEQKNFLAGPGNGSGIGSFDDSFD